jgi:hypothetical protein
MGTHDDAGTHRNLVQVLDKNRTLIAKIRDHVIVVHDLMTHVDRGAKSLERSLNDFNGTFNPGTKTPGLCEEHLLKLLEAKRGLGLAHG